MKKNWKWFGKAGYCCIGQYCRFHLTTQVGDFLVCTIGEYMPPESMVEIINEVKKLNLQGKGDDREADFLKKNGYEDVSCGNKYESVVYLAGAPCKEKGCLCGMPEIAGAVLDGRRYNTAGEATEGHMELCEDWDKRKAV